MLNTEGERRALELCQEVTRHHIPNRWVLDEIRSIMKEHGDGAVLRDFCHTLQGKLALMPVESWPNLSTLEQGIEMNP